jgi:hypothetical protein
MYNFQTFEAFEVRFYGKFGFTVEYYLRTENTSPHLSVSKFEEIVK